MSRPALLAVLSGLALAGAASAQDASTMTVNLATAPLTGATTGLGAPTNAPGAPFTPVAVPQPYNAPGASFLQPGTLTPSAPPGAAPSAPATAPTPAPNPTPAPAPTPGAPATPAPAPAAPTLPQNAPPKHSRVELESTRAAALPPGDEQSLRRLDEENVERHRRLHEQYLARRKLLTDSDDWKFSSWSERRAQLRALKREYTEREAWLRDDYLQKREGLLRMSQGGNDDLRVQGAD